MYNLKHQVPSVYLSPFSHLWYCSPFALDSRVYICIEILDFWFLICLEEYIVARRERRERPGILLSNWFGRMRAFWGVLEASGSGMDGWMVRYITGSSDVCRLEESSFKDVKHRCRGKALSPHLSPCSFLFQGLLG